MYPAGMSVKPVLFNIVSLWFLLRNCNGHIAINDCGGYVYVKAGTWLNLTCNLLNDWSNGMSADPNFTWYWYDLRRYIGPIELVGKERTRIKSTLDSSSLQLLNTTFADTGFYRCTLGGDNYDCPVVVVVMDTPDENAKNCVPPVSPAFQVSSGASSSSSAKPGLYPLLIAGVLLLVIACVF